MNTQVCARFLNADKRYVELLNSYYTSDFNTNEQIVDRFIEFGELYENRNED